jgi:hypothetical protein
MGDYGFEGAAEFGGSDYYPPTEDTVDEKRYRVDCFTPKTVCSDFPENTYYVNTPEQVAEIIRNCSRPIAGIRCVEVWIEKTLQVPHPQGVGIAQPALKEYVKLSKLLERDRDRKHRERRRADQTLPTNLELDIAEAEKPATTHIESPSKNNEQTADIGDSLAHAIVSRLVSGIVTDAFIQRVEQQVVKAVSEQMLAAITKKIT